MVQVSVNEGALEGDVVRSEVGGTYYSFRGVPYAEPPLGDLRFKAPKPPKPWKGVRSAKEFGPICYQYDYFTKAPPSGSEDCLYLNVYTPDLTPKVPFPVMFWIHGGGFIWGSGNDDVYGPELLVRQGVILVTFNYRLHVLGFLSLGTEDIPGNAGMKDQVAALRWVKNNISKFGGDPENITIFGESAGGASVTFHLISPMSKGLFKRAIVQSGAATCDWAKVFEPRERAMALAKKLECNTKNEKDVVKFFKSQPVEKFISCQLPLTWAEQTKIYFHPFMTVVSEKQFGNNERFFYGDTSEPMQNGIHEGVEIMAGYVVDESLILLGFGCNLEAQIVQANNFLQFFVPKSLALKFSVDKQFEIGRKIKEFYFKDENVSLENKEQLLKYISADLIINGVVDFGNKASIKNNVYFYKFTCISDRNIFKQVYQLETLLGDKKMVCHCDDLAYLFTEKLVDQKIDVNSKSFKLIEQVTKLWTNFAKFGNPTPDNSLGVKWLPYTPEQQHFLDIGEVLVPGSKPDEEERKFWAELYKQYLP